MTESHQRPVPPFALVRRPAASLADGCVSFIERQPVDVELAHRQWLGYVDVLHQRGWPTLEVEPDDATVLMSAHAPRTAQLLQERGLTVVTTDISEFEKLEGCVTCLSVRIRPVR